MTLPGVLAVIVVLQGLAAATLTMASARVRLAADQRWAVEAELAAQGALAMARVSQGAALLGIPPGAGGVTLPPPLMPGWEITVHAATEGGDAPIRLTARAVRRNPSGAPAAARTATLLLHQGSADTASVLPHRERL